MSEPLTETFLIKQGWTVKNKYPLITELVGSSDRVTCTIGDYGTFSITEYHWINHDEPVRYFGTIGVQLTEDDYFKIIELTGINLGKTKIFK